MTTPACLLPAARCASRLQLTAVLPGIKEWVPAPELAFVQTWRKTINTSMPNISPGSSDLPDFGECASM